MVFKIERKRNVCLLILDGWGLNEDPSLEKGDSIRKASTPSMDYLKDKYSSLPLNAHGLSVGLPEGQMGNSEVGHMGIGTGRVLYQDIVRIDKEIKEDTLSTFPSLREALLKGKDGKCHFVGLLSDGGVHSHQSHLEALLRTAKALGVKRSFVHAILDGRDCPPKSGIKYINSLLDTFKDLSYGNLATVIGRYWAMDRDKRWERIEKAVDLFCNGVGEDFSTEEGISSLLLEKYSTTSDEFIRPIIISSTNNTNNSIEAGDTVVFFNFRSDRMRQIVEVLSSSTIANNANNASNTINTTTAATDNSTLTEKTAVRPQPILSISIPENLSILTMTPYKEDWEIPTIIQKTVPTNTLAELISKAGMKQFHCAETEKFAHVTFFFNGGRDEAFPGEHRSLIPSPKVATYDLEPGMSVQKVALEIERAIIGNDFGIDNVTYSKDGLRCNDDSNCKDDDKSINDDVDDVNSVNTVTSKDRKSVSPNYRFIVGNFAPPDMVGHTGDLEKAVEAIEKTDRAIGSIWKAIKERPDWVLIITADHGNAEQMISKDGERHTAHTCSRVPFIIADPLGLVLLKKEYSSPPSSAPSLCDIAPTILKILSIQKPAEMECSNHLCL